MAIYNNDRDPNEEMWEKQNQEEETKTYVFTVYLVGSGVDEDEAWRDAVDGFIDDAGPTPDKDQIRELDDED